MSEEKYGFSLESVNEAKHDMIVLVDCHTGYCGEGLDGGTFCSRWL
ncbi:hypothetical protein LPEKDOOE_00171 [Salmonella phage KKP 3953]|nr:hypothetical protein LPEKDOOE_00171 [Salmonella phage KKP 3953]